MKAKRWILVQHFDGVPKEDDLKLIEEDLPELKDNEILLKACYLSVDPYMRLFSSSLPLGSTMIGEQVAQVIESKNSNFSVGSYYLSQSGWRSHFISNGTDLEPISIDLTKNPSELSYCLGTLGMPGATAFIGLIKLCNAQSGEVVLVNSAAGAVGNVVGQLAKIRGCTVIGFAGNDDKVRMLKEELGFDYVFNYKKIGISDALSQVAPEGVDVFFDNVGGDFFHTVVNKHMRKHGRVAICGCIESYNDKEIKTFQPINFSILMNALTIYSVICYDHKKDWPQMIAEIYRYYQQSKIKMKEHVYIGFENMRDAFYGLFNGENTGKSIIKIE